MLDGSFILNNRKGFLEKDAADAALVSNVNLDLNEAKQSEAIDEEDSSRRRILKSMATLYNSGQQIMATINIQNDNQKTNAKAQEFLQIWKEGDTTIDNVLSEHCKLIEEYAASVETYIDNGRDYLFDLEKVGSTFKKIDQLLSTEKEVSWSEVEGILDLSSVHHADMTEQYQKICELTEKIQAQNLAMSHVLLDEGVYNHKKKTLINTPEGIEEAIARIQRNKIKVNPNFGDNSAPILAGTGLAKDQVQALYPSDFLQYQSDFERTQLLFKAKESREKLQAYYDEHGESGDVSLLSEQRLRNEVSAAMQQLDDTAAVQLLDSELGGVKGNTSKERVLVKLALLRDVGQQIKNVGISSSSSGIQNLVQLKLEEQPESTIEAILKEYSQVVKDYKEIVEAYTAGCQKYVGELHDANKLLPRILGSNGAKTNWDEAEKELNSLGVMSIFLHDKSLIAQCEEIRDLEKQREVLNLVLSQKLTDNKIHSGFSALPQSFQNDQETFTDVQAVFKGKENSEKLQKKYSGQYQDEVRQYSELYILNELIGELEEFSKIDNGRLAHKINKEHSRSSEVKGGAQLSAKEAAQWLKSMVSTIVIILSSALPEKQTVRGVIGLGRRRSYDVRSKHNDFLQSNGDSVEMSHYSSTPDLWAADYDVGEEQVNKGSTKMVRSKSTPDLRSTTWYDTDIVDKKKDVSITAVVAENDEQIPASKKPTSILESSRVESKTRSIGR